MYLNDRRFSKRVRCFIEPENLRNVEGRILAEGEFLVLDLSDRGLGLISKSNILEVDEIYTFTLRIEDIPYEMMGKIQRKLKRNEYFEYGIEFINTSNRFYYAMKEYVEKGGAP